MAKIFAGPRLKALRTGRGMRQVDLAALLEISPSYLNQLEHNQRPLTVPVLLRLTEAFGVDPEFFAPDDDARLAADVREALTEAGGDAPGDATVGTAYGPLPDEQIGELIAGQPDVARAVVALYRRYRAAAEHASVLAGGDHTAPAPYEQVRDFFYDRNNHIAVLDDAAEALAGDGAGPANAARVATARLAGLGVRVADLSSGDPRKRHYDPATAVLSLSRALGPAPRAFQLATQLALLEHAGVLDDLTADAALGEQARALTRLGLANYFAGALLLPYGRFRDAAERAAYDIDRLTHVFGVGFETVCHRLSTLQRPGRRGVPFSFLRVDRAGNISKRQSATGFHFTRAGGTCPLWNVYAAFAAPGQVLTQIAEMPDGRRYFWVARTVRRPARSHDDTGTVFAIGLGCELRHARRLTYSRGLDLAHPRPVPIGLGCKVCDRADCPQRAFPRTGAAAVADANTSSFIPYAVPGDR